MAENKPSNPQPRHANQVADFPEVKGKIVDKVEVFSGSDFYEISITFEDRTTLHFIQEPAVFTFPTLSDWADGNEKTLRKYRPVRSKVQRS